MKTIINKYSEKEVVYQRREKPINYDKKVNIRLSSEQLSKVKDKMVKDNVKDLSFLVRNLLDYYLETDFLLILSKR